MIEFVSYDGEYPVLCLGTLKIKTNDKIYELHGVMSSGGECGFRDDYSKEYVTEGDWSILEELLPEELQPYAKEIETLVNENVEKGCCGGCI